ncbi:MAG: hypothetical protein EA425_16645 [Puniceicoccaceae bacterium]|nr:MAG: hypothetical protein EA425_16645 [Puniceicoccaceae bacterium]
MPPTRFTILGLLILAASAVPPTVAAASSPGQRLLDSLGEPLNQGTLLFDARLRWEHADQQGLRSSDAFTVRTRAGYRTSDWHGLYGILEYTYTWPLTGSYAPQPPPFNQGRTPIVDPRSSRVDRLLAGWSDDRTEIVAGRQVINLDNQRFVGAVAWRQNRQTFDALRLAFQPLDDLSFSYHYIDRANRIFGSAAPAPALRSFRSDSHLFNLGFTGLPGARIGAYVYELRFANAAAVSATTFGIYLDGSHPAIEGDAVWLYRLEAAHQADNRASGATADFSLHYLHGRVGLRRQGLTLGLGYEELSGSGNRGFATPLATLHAFNGWADVFLSTPPSGLRDFYAWAQAALPGEVTAVAEAHYYRSARGGETFGREIGLSLRKPLNPQLALLGKATHYAGSTSSSFPASVTDRTKFWIQLDFSL